MTTFTSSLPDELLKRLNEKAEKLAVPKNKIIEKALKHLSRPTKPGRIH